MDDVGLFDDIHHMTNEQLSFVYKHLLDIEGTANLFGESVENWVRIFMDGIQAECADRICGTHYNSLPDQEEKELPNNVIEFVSKN